MFVNFDTETGQVFCTMICDEFPGIPGAWIEVPDQHITNLAGWFVRNGELVLEDLWPIKDAAVLTVNTQIGIKRQSYVTDLPAQDMIYEAKRREAEAYLSVVPAPQEMTGFPFLEAEVGVTAATAYQLAQLWLNMAYGWMQIAASLESVRMRAIEAINEATTENEITAILETVATELDLG